MSVRALKMKKVLERLPRLRLLENKETAPGTEVSRFINSVFETSHMYSYLEIGVWTGRTIEAIKAKKRVPVDPDPRYLSSFSRSVKTYKCTSDSFFLNRNSGDFDCVYLDGLHHFEQTWRDIRNSTSVMRSKGVIFIDDVVPIDKYSALIPEKYAISERRKNTGSRNAAWHGDVYKVMLLFQYLPENFTFGTIEFRKNPRAFLFCQDGKWSSFPELDDKLIASIERREVETVFQFLPKTIIPDYFNPMSPESAETVLKKHLTGG